LVSSTTSKNFLKIFESKYWHGVKEILLDQVATNTLWFHQ